MTNRKRLQKANIINKNLKLTPEQEKAIEDLTKEEVEALISIWTKVADKFPAESLIAPIQHFK